MNFFNNTGKRARIIGTALLFIIFVAGALAGAASERVMRADDRPRGPRDGGGEMRGGPRRLLLDEQFAKELGLSAEQRAEIKTILDRRDKQAKEVWHEVEPRLKSVGDATKAEIQKVLRPDQQQKLDAEIAKRHAAWKGRHKCGDSTKAMPKTP
jgi:Spy/CpxP family protein refolding chaperone